MSKPKEVYATIKRQISATTSGLIPNLRRSSSSHLALKDPNCRWIHPPTNLTAGTVQYVVKMLGHIEVSEAKGPHVVRDAIHAIRFQLQVSGMSSTVPQKPFKVEICINIRSVQILDYKSKQILHSHPLHKVSFCADDKDDKRVFAYIASDERNKHICYLFLSGKNAENITLTIGEAFDLAFQNYIDKGTTKIVPNESELARLKERVEILEAENRALKIENHFYKKQCEAKGVCITYPALPDTPVPKPPSSEVFESEPNFPKVSPLLPPPVSGRRQPPAPPNDSANALLGLDLTGPDVGRKLENLHIHKMDNVFDDSFDPRAGEKKDAHETLKKQDSDDAEDLQAMLEKCDLRINEMTGFTNPRLDFEDINDTNGKDHEYVMPSTSHKDNGNNKK